MNYTNLVEYRKTEARKHNIKEVRAEIESKWVVNKIANYLGRFEGLFSFDQVKEDILNNDIVASFFAKDPSKQNISEKIAEEVLGCKKLSASGKNCIRFNEDGDIVHVSKPTHTKSADFFISGCYATQKYTSEVGGAQDNQFFDVVDFLSKGSKKHKVMAIVDGPFWDSRREDLIKEFESNENVFIKSVDSLTVEVD